MSSPSKLDLERATDPTLAIKILVGHFKSTVLGWNITMLGNIQQWFQLMSRIVSEIEERHGQGVMTGIEKAHIASETVSELALLAWSKFSNGKTPEEVAELKNGPLKMLSVIIDNPEILKASTTFKTTPKGA